MERCLRYWSIIAWGVINCRKKRKKTGGFTSGDIAVVCVWGAEVRVRGELGQTRRKNRWRGGPVRTSKEGRVRRSAGQMKTKGTLRTQRFRKWN